VWPFQTKQLSAYLSNQGLLAWVTPKDKGQAKLQELSAIELEELIHSIDTDSRLPATFKRHNTTLRLAPSLGRCYSLQAVKNKLDASELKGLAEQWGKACMGPKYTAWKGKALHARPGHPILLCACQVDAKNQNVFRSVKPELLNLIDSINANDSAWVVCRDEVLVQSALVLDGTIASIRTWPSHYTSHVKEVIEKHMSLTDDTWGTNIHHVVESRLGEVQTHGAV